MIRWIFDMGTDTGRRIHFLDSLRGFTIIHMVLFHFCYDLVFFNGISMPWYTGPLGDLWGSCIRWSFILISGIVFSMGRHPVKRGAVLLGWGCVLSLVTRIAVPEAAVRFGILSFLGAASLIGALALPYLERIPAVPGMLCSAIFLGLSWTLPQGGLGAGGHMLLKLPEECYQTGWLYWLGFPTENFSSSDYFPVLPWIFLFLFGIFMSRYFCSRGILEKMVQSSPGKLAFLGRHSLFIYLLHQPVLYGICRVLEMIY